MTETVFTSGRATTPIRAVSTAPSVDAPFANTIVELGHERPELVVVSADLSKYTDVAPFADGVPRAVLPGRHGRAKPHGRRRRPGQDRLRTRGRHLLRVCYPPRRRPSPDGALNGPPYGGHRRLPPGHNHALPGQPQGNDDLAIMRAVPGMTVIDPMDATELSAALAPPSLFPAPSICVANAARCPPCSRPPLDFTIGSTKLLRDGGRSRLHRYRPRHASGRSRPPTSSPAAGSQAAVLHVPTLKPFDTRPWPRSRPGSPPCLPSRTTPSSAASVRPSVRRSPKPVFRRRVKRLGVPDSWGGSRPLDYLRARLSLDGPSLARAAHDHLGGR